MPTELVPVLLQFPVVTLVGIAVWVVLKWVDKRSDAELVREQERSERLVQEKARQIGWLEAELTRLRTRNTQLQNELDEARRRPNRGGV